MSDSKHVTYEDAGVDTAEGGRAVDAIKQMVKDTNRPEVIGGIGGFGGLFSAAALKDMEDPILISGTDGVGTKLVLAQIMDRHETVGQDLVAMCVNDILASGAEPLFFLDYVAIGHIEAEHMAKIIKGVADGCKLAGCALVGGEMAEHPGVMAPADYDLAGFTVGVVDRPKMLDPANVRPGDVILGLPSTGVHSNGYSLVRKVIGVDGIKPGTPEAAAKAEELSRPLEELGGASLADALLAPTRIYVKPILELLRGGANGARHRPHHRRRYHREPQPCARRRRRRRGHPQRRRDGLGRSARHHLRVASGRARAQRGMQDLQHGRRPVPDRRPRGRGCRDRGSGRARREAVPRGRVRRGLR